MKMLEMRPGLNDVLDVALLNHCSSIAYIIANLF